MMIKKMFAAALLVSAMGVPAVAAAQQASDIKVTAASRPVPVAEFVKKANMRSPRISPDGTKLAYLAANHGKEVLVVMDLANPAAAPKPLLQADEARESGDRTMSSYRWVGNKHLLMTVLSREDLGFGLGDFSRLVAYNIETGKMTQQAWRGAGGSASTVLHIDHDKGEYLLQRNSTLGSTEIWNLPEVVRVTIDTGQYSVEQRSNPVVRGWAADGEGIVRAGYGYDGDSGKFRMMYRSDGKQNFATVFNKADPTFTQDAPTPQVFIPGTDEAYVMSRHEGYERVYKLNLRTMELSKPVYQRDGFDMAGMLPNEDETDIVGYATFDGGHQAVYLDPDLKQIQLFLDEIFGARQADIIDYDRAKRNVIVHAGGTTKHGGFYFYDTQAGKIQLLNWRSNELKDTPMNPVEAVWYTASDGTKIQAVVTYPRHRGRKNLPVVVIPHGGPFGILSATDQTEPWNQPLAEAGYLVIQPNYRGSGGYGKEFEMSGRKPDGYGKRMQDDLNDAVSYFAAQGLIDKDRACVMGWSYGGYAAARGAQRDPGVWKCAIAGAGVYDFPMMTAWDRSNLGRFSSGFQATSDDPIGISSARNTDGKWAPILIVAGMRDARIPIEQSRTLVSRLKGSGKKEGEDFKYIEQKQGTHNLPYDDVHIQWIEEAWAWLDRYNPAYVPGDTDRPKVTAASNVAAQ